MGGAWLSLDRCKIEPNIKGYFLTNWSINTIFFLSFVRITLAKHLVQNIFGFFRYYVVLGT